MTSRRRSIVRSRLAPGRRLQLEALEARHLLTVDATGIPEWVEQGPGPIITGSSVIEQVGAVNGIAVKPGDPDTVFLATVNGGVWRSLNATYSTTDGADNDGDMAVDESDERPNWEPLTDDKQTLSMSEVAFDPFDATGNTWWAGFGRTSNGFGDGVNSTGGILQTTDNGATWNLLAPNQFANVTVRAIEPTTQLDAGTNQQIVLVAVQGDGNGIFRSIDGGISFTLSLGGPGTSDGIDNDNDGLTDAADTDGGESNFGASDLIADPGNPSRFYAALPEQGVFRTDDAGANWTPVNGMGGTAITGLLPTGTNPVARNVRLLMDVHNSAGDNVVWVGVIRNNQTIPGGDNHAGATRLVSVFRSLDAGANWRQIQNIPTDMGVPNVHPNSMAGGNAYITAHPTEPDVVFVGGAASPRFRVVADDATPANDSWADNYASAGGAAPHADPRHFVFASTTQAYETSDGGIYRLFDPDNDMGLRRWEPMHGNIRPTEFYSVSFDPLNQTVFGGTQDNGTPVQRDIADPTYPLTWDLNGGCDGGPTAIDIATIPGSALHYTSAQNFDACGGLVRREYNASNMEVTNDSADLVVDGTGGTLLTAKDSSGNYTLDPSLPFMPPFVLNAVNPERLIIGTAYLYESMDQGDLLTSLGGVADSGGGVFVAQNPVGNVNSTGAPLTSPIAYGGFAGGLPNEDVLWVGAVQGLDKLDNDMDGNVDEGDERTTTLLLRTSGTGLPVVVPNYNMAPVNGAGVRDIVMDPEDWHIAYLVDGNGSVFRAVTNDDGSAVTFTNLTGNLGSIGTNFRAIEFVRTAGGDEVLLLTGAGGVFRSINPNNPNASPIWNEFGLNVPNALGNEIHYTQPLAAPLTGDVLLLGTYGRGAWTIGNASEVIADNPVLNVCGDEHYVNQDDTILLIRNAGNPALLDIFINGVLEFSGAIAAIQQINVFGVGGNDNLIVDSTNGLINVPTGIRYNGDGKCPTIPVDDGQDDDGDGAGYDRGFDRLTLLQTDGTVHATGSYAVGPQIGSGTYIISDGLLASTQTIFFEELEPVVDVVPVTDYTITATPENNAITYLAGPNSALVNLFNPAGDLTAQVTIDNYEAVEFSNKANVVINAGSGDDVAVVNNFGATTGLVTLTVNGENGDDQIKFLAVAAAAPGGFTSVTANGGAGEDFLTARAVLANTPFTLLGGTEDDTLIGGRGNDLLFGDEGDDTLAGGDPAVTPAIGNNTYDGGGGFDTLLVLATKGNDSIFVDQLSGIAISTRVNAVVATDALVALTVEQAQVEGGQGDDNIVVRVAHNLNLLSLRIDVDGGEPNASDRLAVIDAGIGDLVVKREAPDQRSGSITVGGNAPVVYDGVEFVDISPLNSITGGTGSDGLGRVVVFDSDPFEFNNTLATPTVIDPICFTTAQPEPGGICALSDGPVSPNIDPGGAAVLDPTGTPVNLPGDEDWYLFRAPKIGTFRANLYFEEIATLANGQPGLPGNGTLAIEVYSIVAGVPTLVVGGTAFGGIEDGSRGVQATFSAAAGNSYYLRVTGASAAAINNYDVNIAEVDLLGPQIFDPDGTLGPIRAIQVVTAGVPNPTFNLFAAKPNTSPTPVVNGLLLNVRDLVTRDLLRRFPGAPASDIYPALDSIVASLAASYRVFGDAAGNIAFSGVTVVNAPTSVSGTVTAAVSGGQFTAAGLIGNPVQPVADDLLVFTSGANSGQLRQITTYNPATGEFTFADPFLAAPAVGDAFTVLKIATATIRIDFVEPLPDDRFTLIISGLVDPAGNLLDGESNAVQPVGSPVFSTGDGLSGGTFVARFTVDTRAEIGEASSGSVYVDTNGNSTFDPTNADFTNRDLTYLFGFTSDNVFAGNFAALVDNPATLVDERIADGYDKLGAYGKVGTPFRWIIDTDNDGTPNLSITQPLFAGVTNVNGMPAAGNFDGNRQKRDADADAINGDETVLKVGNIWLLDTNHDFRVDLKLPGQNMVGLPIVGDFDNDGKDDLGAWADNKFVLDLTTAADGTLGFVDGTFDASFTFGFASTRERPIAADFDGDGIDDLGLWVPDRGGAVPSESAEWYQLISAGRTIQQRLIADGGVLINGRIDFKPTPLGFDRFAQFGDEFGLPVVGNFDPPLTSALVDSGGHTNLQNPLDANNDGEVSPLDALLIFNHLNSGAPTVMTPDVFSQAPFIDINQDGQVSPLDALLIFNHLNNLPPIVPQAPEGGDDGEGESAASSDAYFAALGVDAPVPAFTRNGRRAR